MDDTLVDTFRAAVESGDAAAVRHCLADERARTLVNEPVFAFNCPALVASNQNLAVTRVLLEHGADPNRKSDWWAGGFHALYRATPDVAHALLDAGAVPDACAASSLDDVPLLRRLLRENPAAVHERGGDGQMPLHFARSREIVDLLIDAGADLDARDVDHRSTAAEWMIGDRVELARYLVERGASADIFLAMALGITDRVRQMLERDPSLLSLRTSQGEYGERKPSSFHIYQWTIGPGLTPLQVASKFGRREAIAAALPFASPVQRLLLACHEGSADEARAIVKENPGIVERLEGADRRALTDEAWIANAPAVALMMELGFDPSVPAVTGPTGGTALHCAAWEGSAECVEAILGYPRGRELLGVKDPMHGGTPLDWCEHGSRNSGKPKDGYATVARLLKEAAPG